eukprot:9566463-Lingulodinium_polyedra.AAC.1
MRDAALAVARLAADARQPGPLHATGSGGDPYRMCWLSHWGPPFGAGSGSGLASDGGSPRTAQRGRSQPPQAPTTLPTTPSSFLPE